MTSLSNQAANAFRMLYGALFVITLITVTWQYFGMSTRLDLFPGLASGKTILQHNDSIHSGRSKSIIIQQPQIVGYDCQIVHSDTFAFCGINIPVVEAGRHGLNVSHYDSMEIEFDFTSQSTDTLLIYLINNEGFLDGHEILKSNLRAVYPAIGHNRYLLPINQFIVPSWWLFQNPGADPNPRINNVIYVQVSTGDSTVERSTSIRVSRIVLHGKFIAADRLYLGLLLFWALLTLAHTLSVVRQQTLTLRETRRVNEELADLNSFLSIQKDQYEALSKHDPLTGALNRAGAHENLELLLRQNLAGKASAASLLSIDLDHFKEINDIYGHDVGDDVLKKLTRLIEAHTRKEDRFVRWGGEEFILICPDTSLESAERLADNLRKKVEQYPFIEGRRITCSIGIAELHTNDIEQSFKLADKALYQAKHQGRNCVRLIQLNGG